MRQADEPDIEATARLHQEWLARATSYREDGNAKIGLAVAPVYISIAIAILGNLHDPQGHINIGVAISMFGIPVWILVLIFTLLSSSYASIDLNERKAKYIAELVWVGIGEDEARKTADQEYSAGKFGERMQIWWRDYYQRHQQEIDTWKKEFTTLMIEQYQMRPEQVEPCLNPKQDKTDPAIVSFFEGKTATEAAKAVYDRLVSEDKNGNPSIFTVSASQKSSTLNKILFGRSNPTKAQKKKSIIMWLFALPFLYGTLPAINPKAEIFIPSASWYWGGFFVASMGALAFAYYSRRNEAFPLLVFVTKNALATAFLGIALVYGVGRLVTGYGGTKGLQTFTVTKSRDTLKDAGGTLMRAYCVDSPSFGKALGLAEYCDLYPKTYEQLPWTPVRMKFNVRKTFLGTMLTGYFPPE